MSYLDDLGAEIKRRIPQDLLPDEDTRGLFRLYAVLALAKGRRVSPADVHNAWAAWTAERRPGHHSLKPFEELDAATQAYDEPFADAIRKVAENMGELRSNRRPND